MAYDLLNYICPPQGNPFCLFGLGEEHCQCVQAPDNWIEFRKNRHMEEFYVTDTVIGRGADTSEISTDGVHPTGNFYIQYTRQPNGELTYGAPWAKRLMAVGDRFRRDCHIIRYRFDGTVIEEGDAVSFLEVKAHYPSRYFPQSGITIDDVLELQWGGEEVYYYANGYGLVGWQNLRDPNKQSFIGSLTTAVPEPFPHDVKPRPRAKKPHEAREGRERRGPAGKKMFVVVWDEGLWVRDNPSRAANKIGEVSYLDTIHADTGSRRVDDVDGLIWWQHDDGVALDGDGSVSGWSAEQWPAKGIIYMKPAAELLTRAVDQPAAIRQFITDENDPFDVNDPNAVPCRDSVFQLLPVERLDWVQHFGNTEFAFHNQSLYSYSQGLHGGIDLADSAADNEILVPVRAGVVKGKVIEPLTSFGPRKVRVRVEIDGSGRSYTIIYGHLHPEPNPLVAEGTEVHADTILGYIATPTDLNNFESPAGSGEYPYRGMSPHLHLEIRFTVAGIDYIMNPLLFIPDLFRDALARKQPYFHEWYKWQTPFDQPVVRRSGVPIGPHTES